jgi:hypothetical protein
MEASQPAQASREAIDPSLTGEEIRGESSRAPGRPSLSQPRGQHAHGIEETFEEEIHRQENSEKACRPQKRSVQGDWQKVH